MYFDDDFLILALPVLSLDKIIDKHEVPQCRQRFYIDTPFSVLDQ